MIGPLNHLWQSTCFAIAAGLLAIAFRSNRASVRHWLWLCASLKFLLPFSLLMSLGSQLQFTPAARRIATQIAAPAVGWTMEQISQPFFYNGPPVGVESDHLAPRHVDLIFPVAVLGLWLSGFMAIASIRLRDRLRIRAAVRAGAPVEIPSPIEILSSPGLLEPGVVGLLKPVLLLPEGIMERLTQPQLEAVLAHELCHVRRRDNLFASIHMLVEAIFWFHPLVWWIGARLVEERERACDEDVLRRGNQPRDYADAILSVCRLYVESPLACVAGVTGSNIGRRIEAIMTNRRGRTLNSAKKLLLASAGFVALAGPVAMGVLIGVGRVPVLHAQSPVAAPTVVQTAIPAPAPVVPAVPSVTPKPSAASVAAAAPAVAPRDRRLVAMLFDFRAMNPEDQARARASATRFVQNDMKPADLVCIMAAAEAGPLIVTQDFTADHALLQSVIGKLSAAGEVSASAADTRFATIETAAKMLGGFPEKKALMYFSSGIAQTGTDHQAELRNAINTAKQANVAIYPIDPGSARAAFP